MPDARRDKEGPCWRKRTGLEKTLIFGVIVFGALAVILLLIFAFQDPCVKESPIFFNCTEDKSSRNITCDSELSGEEDEECNTRSCVKAAAELLEFIDLKADPCHNFYKFACGTFFKNAVKKDSPSPWTSTRTLFENEMKGIVVDPIGVNNTNAHILMKKFYHECMNTTKIEQDDNRAFMDAIDELGGWPLVNGSDWDEGNFSWVQWYIKAKQMGLPVIGLFHFDQSSSAVLRVRGPYLDSDTFYTTMRFKKLMKGLSSAFSAPVNYDDYNDIHSFINALYRHRYELDSLFDDDDNDDDDEDDAVEDDVDEDNTDTDDYDEKTNSTEISTIADLTEICPNIPWLEILNGISGNSSQFDNTSKVHFLEETILKYCDKLDTLLENTKPEVIANYYIWSIIHNAHKYMSREVRSVYEDVDDEGDDRFTVCYNSVDERFKFLKETIYIRKKTFKTVRNDLFEMIQIIKDLFMERLKKGEWMDETSKAMALEKASKIENLVGAEDDLYDVEKFDKILGLDGLNFTSDNLFKMYQEKLIKEDHSFFEKVYEKDEDDWPSFFENVVEVNAFFLLSANLMVIPAPILTSIFYNRKFPASMNYGAMGSTVGHELMHGFTESSRKYIVDDEVIDWWTNATKEAYDKQIQCIIDEYESIPFKYRLNGTLTLEENIADFVGADIGYEAYQVWVEKYGKEQKLAGVPLTPEQIYWVQTATNFCFRKLDDNDIDYEEEDAHGIPAFRVEGPARHSLHFAEAFNCPVGSFMNPKEKCRIL